MVMIGCRGERCHDDSVAKLALAMSVEAAYHNAVSRTAEQLPQHDVIGAGPRHCLTPVAVVVIVIATIEYDKPIHPHSLLRDVLRKHMHSLL